MIDGAVWVAQVIASAGIIMVALLLSVAGGCATLALLIKVGLLVMRMVRGVQGTR